MRNLTWIGLGLWLLLLLAVPGFGVALVPLVLMIALWGFAVRRGWRFIAPERARLMRGLALSVERGPVASGLLPFLAAWTLCLLVAAAGFGVLL